jgi:hypothetical protein
VARREMQNDRGDEPSGEGDYPEDADGMALKPGCKRCEHPDRDACSGRPVHHPNPLTNTINRTPPAYTSPWIAFVISI